jgi:hypothetical protein
MGFLVAVRQKLIKFLLLHLIVNSVNTLQGQNTEISEQIFPEKELLDLSPSFHIHVPVSDLQIPRICLPILLPENKWTDSWNIYKSFTDTSMWK